jgi:hypothetical protein
MDAATWIGQFAEDGLSPLERSMALASMRDRKDELDAQRAQADKDAAAAQRREEFLLLNARAGDPVGEMSRARQAWSEADDMRRDALDQLRKADARIARAERSIEFWAARLEPVTQAAQRSRVPSDPVEAALYHAHQAFKETTQAMRAEARAARPKGGGYAVRNEPVTCPECLAVGADPTESFLIHHMTADGQPISEVPDRPVPAPVPDDAERRVHGGYSVITR